MSKIPRDARAFARRVRMGATKVWLLVEGRSHDRAFYDRLLMTVDELDEGEYEVRLVEQLEVDGISSGGKAFLRRVFQLYQSEDLLAQSTDHGERRIAFAMDRDVDHLVGDAIDHPHLIYTATMDVEAEILRNGDITGAVSSAYSVTRAQAFRVVANGQDVFDELANIWRDWIQIGIVAHCCGCGTPIQHSTQSKVNAGVYGPVDGDLVLAAWRDTEARVDAARQADLARHREEVAKVFEAGQGWTLVKGKWISSYVHHLVKTRLASVPRESSIPADTVVRTCVETIDFRAPWADGYRARLRALLAA